MAVWTPAFLHWDHLTLPLILAHDSYSWQKYYKCGSKLPKPGSQMNWNVSFQSQLGPGNLLARGGLVSAFDVLPTESLSHSLPEWLRVSERVPWGQELENQKLEWLCCIIFCLFMTDMRKGTLCAERLLAHSGQPRNAFRDLKTPDCLRATDLLTSPLLYFPWHKPSLEIHYCLMFKDRLWRPQQNHHTLETVLHNKKSHPHTLTLELARVARVHWHYILNVYWRY